MPPFPKPRFTYAYDVAAERARLREHRAARNIPGRTDGKLLLLTWNIANLGQQERTDDDLTLIAEVMSWFDIIGVQECKESFGHLFEIVRKLGSKYRVVCSDASGNNERMAFVYDSTRLSPLEEIGEIAVPVSQYRNVRIRRNRARFIGFDRSPYLASFAVGRTSLVLVNVHLYYGGTDRANIARRSLETYAVAKWAAARRRSRYSFTRELAALGDFNMPVATEGDPVFDALTGLGLVLPEHSSRVASSIMSDAEYDQVAFFPGGTNALFTGRKGVFDFDHVLFPDLYGSGEGKQLERFKAYCRYHLSDHRPMWVELGVG